MPTPELQSAWENGRDFRWYCTACHARWWGIDDMERARHQMGLEIRRQNRMTRPEAFRQRGGPLMSLVGVFGGIC